jgi:transcriptional regulator with GAF, ATPase, and Fis domain
LIIGESGTEKEIIAKIIHQLSHRSDKEFISVKCDNLTDNIIDRDLFGYEPGAFADAIKTRKGKIEYADGGTIFLDGISDLSPYLQSKLIELLNNSYFERI